MTVVSVRDITVKGYVLSVTTRYQTDEDTLEHLEELTFRTVESWLFIADLLERNIYEIKAEGSIESRYQAQKGITLKEHFGDSRVTVWSTFRGAKNPNFHLNSDDNTQVAINTWLASRNAVERIIAKHADQPTAQNAPQTASNGSNSNSSASPATPITPQTASQAPIPGVLAATRAPSPATPQYADGQLVSYRVNRIVASSNNGSATFQLWGELGAKYPLVTVYKLKPDGTEKPDYLKIKGIIASLNLSLDKTEAAGNWYLVCKAAHAKGKEFMNIDMMEAVTA